MKALLSLRVVAEDTDSVKSEDCYSILLYSAGIEAALAPLKCLGYLYVKYVKKSFTFELPEYNELQSSSLEVINA